MDRMFKIVDHRLQPATWVPSPNYDERPEGEPISLVVLHGISLPPGEFGGKGVEALFTNQLDPNEHPYYAEIADLKVSSHLFIRRDGEVIQFVPFHQRAWHAGQSVWQGRTRCNDFSIGIELEGTDDFPYRAEQYIVLAEVVKALQTHYQLPKEAIARHSEIAPGRKTDPGEAFSSPTLYRLLERIKKW